MVVEAKGMVRLSERLQSRIAHGLKIQKKGGRQNPLHRRKKRGVSTFASATLGCI